MKRDDQPKRDEPERISIAPLDPVEALKGLLRVDPDSKPAKPKRRKNPPKKRD